MESAPKICPLLFEKFENTPEGARIARRGRDGPTPGPPHRRGPEEIDAHGLEGGAKSHPRPPADPQALDPGEPVVLQHSGLYAGPPAIAGFKFRGGFVGPPPGQPQALGIIAQREPAGPVPDNVGR